MSRPLSEGEVLVFLSPLITPVRAWCSSATVSGANTGFRILIQLYGPRNVDTARLELSFGQHNPGTILFGHTKMQYEIIIISAILGGFFVHFANVETRVFTIMFNFFAQSVVFLVQAQKTAETCCLEVEEQTLTFSKHQKLLKSNNNSWRNLNFSDRVD